MPRPEKVQAVADIKQAIEDSEAIFVTEFRGLSVKQLQDLRRGLRASGAEYKVVKMTLARLAAKELGLESMTEYLAGPTAIAFAHTDPAATAKVLAEAGKDNENLVIKAGLLSREMLLPEQISRLAQIEPREVLLAKIAGAARAPMARLAWVLASFGRDAATMFTQLLEKMEAAGDTTTAAAEPEERGDEAPSGETTAGESLADETTADDAPVGEAPAGEDEPAAAAEEE